MKPWKSIFDHHTIRLLNHTNLTTFQEKPFTALESFALEDALTLSVSEATLPPIIRLWAHDQTVVLGIPDSRLPYLKEGIHFLHKHGYQTIIRNSGGLAVPLDRGVLNLSFIVPRTKSLSIDQGYEAMFAFIKYIFRDLTNDIEAYEIVGSYCPGDFDLSIDGKKFAGISQRRVRKGVAIQIYLDLFGDTFKKGELIRDFYQISIQNKKTSFDFPQIKPETVKSLSDLIGKTLTIEEVTERIYEAIRFLKKKFLTTPLVTDEIKHYEDRLQLMYRRNQDILS